jgi:conjugal transfer mating pair stabilization protein TraG
VDIRPMRSDGINGDTKWTDPNYSQDLTLQLIQDIRANGNVDKIFFNDPELIKEGIVKPWPGRDNHFNDMAYHYTIIGKIRLEKEE